MARVLNRNETKIRCGGCGSDIAYNRGDVREGRDEDDGAKYKYVKCPGCGRTIDLLKFETERQASEDHDL